MDMTKARDEETVETICIKVPLRWFGSGYCSDSYGKSLQEFSRLHSEFEVKPLQINAWMISFFLL